VSLEAVGNAFKFKSASNDDVFIGEPADAVFHPIAKLNRWGGECFLKFVFDDSEIDTKNMRVNDGKVEWDTPMFTFRYYQTADGLEFEVVLKAKPLKNSFSFLINTQKLKFYYQRPLTEEFNPNDCIELSEIYARLKNGGEFWRPENVVGSYAVYHDFKRDNQYQTGKAFHIYRPQLVDASGAKAWATLNIDEHLGVMIITLPEDFLDHATYPVVVDPTFGYTSIGGSTVDEGQDAIMSCKATLSEAAHVESISFYGAYTTGSSSYYHGKCAIYNASANFVSGSDTEQINMNTTPQWWTANLNVHKDLAAADYYIALFENAGPSPGAWRFYYDTGGVPIWQRVTYGNWPASITDTMSYVNYRFSIYATYTTGAVVKTVTESLSLSDAVLRNKIFAITDALGLSDLIRRNKTFAVADSIGVADAVRGNKSPLIVADAVSLSELINIITGAITKTVADAIGASDTALINKTALIVDAVNLADVARALKTLNVFDTLSLVDSASTPSRVIRALESIIIADNAFVNKTLQVTEAISLAEIVEVGAGGIKKTKLFLILGDLAVQLTGD
jgi:hypothetical protein